MVILISRIYLFLSICILALNTAHADVVPLANSIVEKIEWHAPTSIKNRFQYYFEEITGHTYDPIILKIKLDQINKEIYQSGYFTATSHLALKGSPEHLFISLTIDVGERVAFEFNGNSIFSRQELYSKLMDKIKNDFGKSDIQSMKLFLIDEYELAGYYNTIVKITYLNGHAQDGSRVKNYFVLIQEGDKIPVNHIRLRGAYHFSEEELEVLLNKTGSALAANKFYDKLFFENFSEIIKKEYLRKGFTSAEVSLPHQLNADYEEGIDLEYSVVEKQQVKLKKIEIKNLKLSDQIEIKKLLSNQEDKPLNIIELEKDFKKTINYLQGEGFYFANISNLNSNNLLVYDKSLTSVNLNLDVITDRQVCFNDTIINGNIKTKGEVIYREVTLKKGDLITPEALEEIQHKISNLGLFSSAKITPYMLFDGSSNTCARTNLVIQVKEKEFGLVELAPGYRTDLGMKVSTVINYNNIAGMNRSASLKTEFNKRDNLTGFDEARRIDNNRFWEYSFKASVIEPYIFYNILKTQVEFEISSSLQRKRFYGFDADIKRISPQFSKTFTKYLSSSVKYQFERINQFDATLLKDNDNFTIGGVTLAASVDMRDDPINSRRGPYFSLSSEWANPYFGSMKTSDLEVNFVKVINRNKYYYPIKDFTLAFFLGMGMEKNFAVRGYIPSIKVFRLDGYDEIRGYDEGEINHLINGLAIGDVKVDQTAYFSAFKFEPRYNINDNTQVDIFFDAGRVFVNSFQPLNLRTSAGIGFKFLTAVGALDFSYGVKLNKKTYADGKGDSVGRFHLSIGYF